MGPPPRLRRILSSLAACYSSRKRELRRDMTGEVVLHRQEDQESKEDIIEDDCISDVEELLDYFSFIPDDILLRILSFLDDEDWEVCKLVCKKWHLMRCKTIKKLNIFNRVGITECRKIISSLDSISNLTGVMIVDHRRDSSIPLLEKLSSLNASLKEFEYSCQFRSKNPNYHQHPDHHNLVRHTLSFNPLIEKLSLKFMYDDKLDLDLSFLPNLKSLSVDANIHTLLFSDEQMEKIEELSFTTPLRNILICLTKLFDPNHAFKWTNLKSVTLTLRLENFMDLNLDLLKSCLFSIPNLKSLELFGGSGIGYNLSFDFGQILDLSKLVLSFGNLEVFPPWIFRLKNLTSLTLFKVKSIENISSLTQLPYLKHLKLTIEGKDDRDCKNEQNLQQIQEMTQLESLHLHCDYINIILPCINQLVSLKELDLRVNFAVCILIRGIHNLPSLQSLGLRFLSIPRVSLDLDWPTCLKLQRLSSNFSIIRNLAYNIDIVKLSSGVNNLVFLSLRFNELQDMDIRLISNFTGLKHLELFDSKIEEFPDSFRHLNQLTFFKIQGFLELQSLTFLQHCPMLKILHIHNAPNLSFISEAFFGLKYIREIQVRKCPRLAAYDDKFRKMAFRFVS